jgi:DNA-binding IclR family transcriptional regulator
LVNPLSHHTETKKFVLGPLISQLSHAMNCSLKTDLVLMAKPCIDAPRAELKETVTLEVLSGKSIYMVYIAEGPQLLALALALAGNIGERVPPPTPQPGPRRSWPFRLRT